jgi:hypothetical protein
LFRRFNVFAATEQWSKAAATRYLSNPNRRILAPQKLNLDILHTLFSNPKLGFYLTIYFTIHTFIHKYICLNGVPEQLVLFLVIVVSPSWH